MPDRIFLDSASGKVCCLYNHVEGSNAIVIIGHGFLSDKNSRTGFELYKKLGEAGISTLRIDLYGHGESEGDIEYLTVSKAVENVIAAYDFANEKGYSQSVNRSSQSNGSGYKKFGLVGSSFSGIVSLIAATKRKFDVLSLKCPVFDYQALWADRLGKEGLEKWKKEGFTPIFSKKVHFSAFEDASTYNMKEIASKITCPVLVIHGDQDTTVHVSHAEDIIKYVKGEKKLVIIKGADHFFKDEIHFQQLINESMGWLKRHLV